VKVAIHHTQGSFSEHWIEYCQQNNVPFKIVNCYDNDIISQVKDCDALMWHHHHENYKDVLFAKALLFSLEQAGIKIFPDFNTAWHFDDKVGQKYLLEAIGAPLAPSFIFYTKKDALNWVNETSFPKVFKLRGGSGAANVKLVKNKSQAKRFVNSAFGRGFPQFDRVFNLKERIRKVKEGKGSYLGILKGIGRLIIPTEFGKMRAPEKGYVYFQEFIPDNKTDFRIKIVSNRCWGFQRKVRDNDFRASGSDNIIYDREQIPISMIKAAFSVSNRLNLQSVAFDFVLKNGTPLIVEMSYGFGIDKDEFDFGYWDSDLEWHEGKFNPYGWMVEEVLK
jgi:glutathione synthase/RimK-type ligase-like ATP-grasp enzyme